jgi:hypothetical protein
MTDPKTTLDDLGDIVDRVAQVLEEKNVDWTVEGTALAALVALWLQELPEEAREDMLAEFTGYVRNALNRPPMAKN